MSGLDRVRAALGQAARDGVAADAVRSFDRPEAGVAAMLATIDATILPRQVTFAFDTGDQLDCVAANRRIVRLLPPGPQGSANRTLFDTVLQPEQVPALAEMLVAACTGSTSLRVETRRCDPVEGGVSAAAVGTVLGLRSGTAQPDGAFDPLDMLAEAISPSMLSAFRLLDEDVEILRGGEADVTALTEFAGDILERMLDPSFPLSATFETDGVVTFGLPEEVGRHVVIAGHLGRYLVAVVAGADPTPTLAAWGARPGVDGSSHQFPSD